MDPRRDEDEPQWSSLYGHFLHLTSTISNLHWGIEEKHDGGEPDGAIQERDGEVYLVLTHSPETPWPYLMALHEIGHLMTYVPGLLEPDLEALAWRWALDHSSFNPSVDDRYQIRQALETYRCARWDALLEDLTS